MNSYKKKGFTLIELLVVIAIIGILMGLLLPAVQAVREAARRTQCKNNQRQIGLALQLYHDTFEYLPSGWIASDASGEPGWGWAAATLPYLEGGNLYDKFDLSVPIDDSTVANLRTTVIPTFICPSDGAEDIAHLDELFGEHNHAILAGPPQDHEHDEIIEVSKGNYTGVFGSNEIEVDPTAGNGTFFQNSRTKFSHIKDGLTSTFLVGERNNEFGTTTWVGVSPAVDEPFARVVGSADHTPNHMDGHFEDFSSNHPNGCNFVFGDGSVRFIPDTIDEETYQSMATRDGKEVVSNEF